MEKFTFDPSELSEEEFSKLIGFVAESMVRETFEMFSLDSCPEPILSTYIFGLVDTWFNTQGKDKKGIVEFLGTIKRVGTETYDEERRRKNA